MVPAKLYLRQNVLVEPLFNQWYAWSYLISPATAAMFVVNSHLKIMQSFVNAPQVHVMAQKNPAMRGGPFINYGPDRVGDIRKLLESTVRRSGRLLEFAAAVEKTDGILVNEAKGNSMEALYQRLPEALRGYVELVYDLNDSPSFRLIEGLLYKSPYYDESSQSVALSLLHRDERPFALSTPCLRDEGRVFVQLPFRSAAYDELFHMKRVPQPLEYIQEALGVGDDDREMFSAFFTEAEPLPPPRYDGDDVRVRYFGHACVLIESARTSVLIDPLISYKYEEGIFRYTYADLPESIDYVLITHNHQDHCMLETLLQLRHRIGTVLVPKNNGGGLADPSLKLMLQAIGFQHVREVDELESVPVADGEIVGLPFFGEHADLNIRSKLAYRVTLRNQSILCAADSNNIEPRLYEHTREALGGDIDVLFLGMECEGGPMSWLYGPLMTRPVSRKMDQARRLNGSNYERGIELISLFNPRQAYVYAMGQEPWLTYLTSIEYTEQSRPILDSGKLVEDCLGRGLTSERLYGHREITLPAR